MSVYTVHEPPRRGAAAPEAERFAFVRDGFSLWAFLVAPLWMLRHRMWLVLFGYVVIAAGLQIGVRVLGGSAPAAASIGILLGLLVGLEASTLRRFTLCRRGWINISVVSGDDVEDAERRFFDGWVRQRAAPASAPVAGTSPPVRPTVTPVQRMSQAPAVVGLFPEPGAPR
jgi:hypothetical protein